MEDNMVSG